MTGSQLKEYICMLLGNFQYVGRGLSQVLGLRAAFSWDYKLSVVTIADGMERGRHIMKITHLPLTL
jgi:hypothetical protein